MTTLNGKCHCGQVEVSVKFEDNQKSHVLCHCDTCKILSGSAATLNQIVPKEAIHITKGEDTLSKYTYSGDSGKPVDCFFCPNCSTHIYHIQHVADIYIIRTALFDQALKEFSPAAEVYGKAKMPWEKEVAHTFELLPPH